VVAEREARGKPPSPMVKRAAKPLDGRRSPRPLGEEADLFSIAANIWPSRIAPAGDVTIKRGTP